MRKGLIILFLICGLAFKEAYGQQLPLFSQYMYNELIFNPAFAGTNGGSSIRLTSRDQWEGIEGHPKTQALSVDSKLLGDVNMGGFVFNDVIGPIQKTGASIAYSYNTPLTDKSSIAFGLSVMSFFYKLKTDNIKLDADLNTDDYLLATNKNGFYPNYGFGVLYFTKKYYIGFSIPEMIKNSTYLSKDFFTIEQHKHFYLLGSYKVFVNKLYAMRACAKIRYVYAAPLNIDMDLIAESYNGFSAGLGYRSGDAIVAMLGIKFWQHFRAVYSFDFTTTQLSRYSNGTHEITVGYEIQKRKRKVICAAYDN